MATWSEFAASTLPAELSRVNKLLNAEPDPSAPYQALYDAADALARMEERADALAAANDPEPAARAAARFCADRLRLERGLVLLQTDLLCEAEPLVSGALARRPEGWAPRDALRARNALAALWCDRDDAPRALAYLQEAQAAYDAWRGGGGGGGGGGAAAAG